MFLGLIWGNEKETAKFITYCTYCIWDTLKNRYNLIHIVLTFKMIGDVKQSRLLGVNKRILGFKTADCGQRFCESSGHTLLHVTQHGESTYK